MIEYPHESEEPLKRSQAILTTWYIQVYCIASQSFSMQFFHNVGNNSRVKVIVFCIELHWISMQSFHNFGNNFKVRPSENSFYIKCKWGEPTSASIFLSPGKASEWRGLVQAARPYTCIIIIGWLGQRWFWMFQIQSTSGETNRPTKQPTKQPTK